MWIWMYFVLEISPLNIHSSFVMCWDVCNFCFHVFLQSVHGLYGLFLGLLLLTAFSSGCCHFFSTGVCILLFPVGFFFPGLSLFSLNFYIFKLMWCLIILPYFQMIQILEYRDVIEKSMCIYVFFHRKD